MIDAFFAIVVAVMAFSQGNWCFNEDIECHLGAQALCFLTRHDALTRNMHTRVGA